MKWMDDELNIILNHYAESKKDTLLEYLPLRGWGAIVHKANELGIKRQHAKSIIDFFNIDSELKAYLLGFISADGCLYHFKNKYWKLQIDLSCKDKEHVILLRDLISPKSTVYTCVCRTACHCCFYVEDNKLCHDLLSHGLTPRKSFSLSFPELAKDLEPHNIRGYFDGDGHIGKKMKVSLHAGSSKILEQIDSRFKRYYNNKASVRKEKSCYTVAYGGTTTLQFCQYI